MSSTLNFQTKTLTSTDKLVGFQGTSPGDERTFQPGACGALIFGGATAADVRGILGLGNVDNTSDANKPISTATGTALALKANTADLSAVATSGDYNDLGNLPTLGTAASRDVGQAAGNVLEFASDGSVYLGEDGLADGRLYLWNQVLNAYGALYSQGNSLLLSTGSSAVAFVGATGLGVTFNFSGNTATPRTYTLPDASGTLALTSDLSALNASNLTSGTVPDARFPATLPALSGVNLTALNASNLTSGTVALARLPTVTVPYGGTGSTTLSANAVLLGNGTSALQTVAPGTSGNVLTSNGTTWTSAAPTGGGVPTSRTISTTAPLTGGGDLSADRTLAVSAATTTTAGTVPGIGGTSVSNAASIGQTYGMHTIDWPLTSTMWAQAVTGSGSTTRGDAAFYMQTGSTSSSTALARSNGTGAIGWPLLVSLNSGSSFLTDYSRALVWSFSFAIGAQTTNGTVRVSWGKTSADGVGDLARHGWQIKVTGASGTTVEIGTHNGTTLATTTVSAASGLSGYTPHPCVVILSGGTMSFYYGADAINLATPTATLSGAPTQTTGTANSPFFQVEVSNGADASNNRVDLYALRTRILR